MPTSTRLRSPRRARLPQLEARTPLVAIAATLAFRAKITFAHSASFRRGFTRRADAGRQRLHVYLRHWLAARLHEDRPEFFRKLPAGYCTGDPLPARPATHAGPVSLSNEARQLLAI